MAKHRGKPGAIYGWFLLFFFSSRRRHTRSLRDWSSDVCSSDLAREYALALDDADPLAGFAAEFVPAPGVLYLDGNSLGRLPRSTAGRVAEVVADEWGGGLVRSWSTWISLARRIGDLIGTSLLGARPGEVVVADSTSVNLYKLAWAAVSAESVVEALDRSVAVVVLSHVAYRSGALLDLPAITAAAHEAGALVLWDLSHSGGSVPVGLAAAAADLAVGCTYKYLNGGPGSPAYLYVRSDLQAQLRQPIQGWFGAADQFAMPAVYEPAPGIDRFLVGTPPVLSLVGVEEGVRVLAEAGIDRLRAKGQAMTAYLVTLADAWLAPLGFRLASPRDPALRGSHVSLEHPQAWQVCQALLDRGVVPDYRTPDRLRLGPAPLTTHFAEVYDALAVIRDVVSSGAHRGYPSEIARVT